MMDTEVLESASVIQLRTIQLMKKVVLLYLAEVRKYTPLLTCVCIFSYCKGRRKWHSDTFEMH